MNCWKSCSGLLYSLGSAVLSVLLLWGHFLPQRPFDSFPSPILTVLLPSFPQWICRTCLGSRCITAFSRRQAEIKFIFLCLVLVWWHPIHYTSVVFIFPLRMECFVFINPKCFLVSSIPVALLLRLQCMLFLFSCGPLCYNVMPKYCGTMPERLYPSEASPQGMWRRKKIILSWFWNIPATISLGLAVLWREER